MTVNRLSIFLASILSLSLLSTASQAADEDLLREMRDRSEIEALMWRYVRALDTLDAEAYAAVFTENGSFGTGANATVGRQALEGMVEGLAAGRAEREANGEPPSPPMHHVIANHWIEFIDEDSARMHSYWMTVFGPAGQGGTPNVAAVGRGIDELVRVDGQWLISSRNVAPQD